MTTETTDRKPTPVEDPDSAPYWEAAREGNLVIQSCEACGEYQFYPRALCRGCWSTDLSFEAVPGTGTVYAFTISHIAGQPGFTADVPYNYALVEIDLPNTVPDQPPVRLPTQIIGCEHGALTIGLRVEVVFHEHEGDSAVVLPYFEPLEE